jgi:hypothetical protein
MIKIILMFVLSVYPENNAQIDRPKYSIEPYSVISDTKMVDEGSTLAKSPVYDVIWTLNDSGDSARIFAMDINGKLIKPSWVKKYNGVKVVDAINIDWEAMTFDENGDILICDCGNNYNYRRDLSIYRVSEPNPYYADQTGIIAKYPFKLPDQNKFPPENKLDWNFDIESIFVYNGYVYLISKNRGNTTAKIYRFKNLKPFEMNIPEIYKTFDFKSMVTDASVSPDKKNIAVLTYNYIWIFETDGENPFGKYYYKDISLGQCEGVSFLNNEEIIISNEEGYLFRISLKEIKK